jgi:diguanylate cyclase (GGDEF)-like protein
MKIVEVHLCNCELMLELTYKDCFDELDQALVTVIQKLTKAQQVSLYLGEFNEAAKKLAEAGAAPSETATVEPSLVPIKLTSGQTLSLVIGAELNAGDMSGLVQLIAVYSNQYEHLSRANKDRLTGLKNRRAFDQEYGKIISQIDQNSAPAYVLAVLDIDHFKAVNDQFGHLIGDETLIAVSQLMKEFFDLHVGLYRFGGEEFVALIPHVGIDDAGRILNALRKKVADYRFPQLERLTVSIGFVEVTAALSSSLLFERADAALYRAKENGRNCVVGYERLVNDGLLKPIQEREGEIELF